MASPQPGSPPPPPIGMRYRFRVKEDFSGWAQTSVEMVRLGMTSCDLQFALGEEYVVYAARSRSASTAPNEFFGASKCDRSQLTAQADSDLQYLRAARQHILAGHVLANYTRVAGQKVIAQGEKREYEATTDRDGLYQFVGVVPGPYKVTIPGLPGIQTRSIRVEPGQCATLIFLSEGEER